MFKRTHFKKEMTFIRFIILSVVLLELFAVNTSALGIKLLCLDKGQKIEFSQCNPNMNNKICQTSSCQICVNEIKSGVFCPANINNCKDPCVKLGNDNPSPVQPPTSFTSSVMLIEPQENYFQQNESQIDFTFKITDSSKISKCSLMLDSNETIFSKTRIQSGTNKLSYKVPFGEHVWNIRCYSRDSNQTTDSETRKIAIGSKNDQWGKDIMLISPEDNFTATGTQIVDFVYNLSKSLDVSKINKCELFLNNESVSMNNNMSITSLSNSLPPANYGWNIKCTKLDNSSISSVMRFLTINNPPPQQSNNGGGSSGGGSSGGDSSGGGGFVLENKPKNKSTNSTNSIQKIEQLTQGTEENSSQNNDTVDGKVDVKNASWYNSITGAVVGAVDKVKNNRSTAIGFVIFAVVALVLLNVLRKKKEDIEIQKLIRSLAVTP